MTNLLLSAQQLSIAYDDDVVLDSINISINKGDFVFITGASGSGKSTLVKTFYGAISPNEGELSVCGYDMNSLKNRQLLALRRQLGIIFQDYRLFHDMNVLENVMLPLKLNGYSKEVRQSQAEKLLIHVKLFHQSDKFPLHLSGGEQQRVALARALSNNPELILADEPTGNLDEYSAEVIWNLFESANVQLKTTIIVVTHTIPSTISIPYRHFTINSGELYEVS